MRLNRSIFISFFLSYVLLAVIIVSLILAPYSRTVAQQRRQELESCANAVMNAAGNISKQLSDCSLLLDCYRANTDASYLITAQGRTSPIVRSHILSLFETLKRDKQLCSVCDNIICLVPRLKLIVSSNGSCEEEVFFSRDMETAFASKTEFNLATGINAPERLHILESGALVMGIPLSLINPSADGGAIIMVIDKQQLLMPMSNLLELLGGAVQITSREGRLMYALGSVDPDNAKLHSITYTDPDWQFTLTAVLDPYALPGSTEHASQTIVIITAACLALAGVIAFVLSVHFYRPVKRIASLVYSEAQPRTESNWKHIEQSIQSIIDEKKRLDSAMELHRPELVGNVFRRFLSGEAGTDEAADFASSIAAKDCAYFSIFAITGIDETGKTVRALNEKSFISCCITVTHMAVGLMHSGGEEEAASYARALYEELNMSCEDSVCMAVSSPFTQLCDMPIVYRETLNALDYQYMLEGGGLLFAEQMPGESAQSTSITLYDHLRLQEAIRGGNTEEARKVFDGIANMYFPPSGVPLPVMKCRMFSLVQTLITAENCENTDVSEKINVLLECDTIKDMLSQARSFLDEICALRAGEPDHRSAIELHAQVLSYISDNHTDQELTVASVAEHFSVSPSYLARIFKQTSDTGILDTIHAARIDHVKQLLSETELTMKEICAETGYPSEQTLFRAFKRKEGMTPKQYRELLNAGSRRGAVK